MIKELDVTWLFLSLLYFGQTLSNIPELFSMLFSRAPFFGCFCLCRNFSFEITETICYYEIIIESNNKKFFIVHCATFHGNQLLVKLARLHFTYVLLKLCKGETFFFLKVTIKVTFPLKYYIMIIFLIWIMPCSPLFFLTAIWLPHGQLWAIIEGAASLTRC